MSAEVGGCGLGARWHQLLGFLAPAASIIPGQLSSHTSGCNYLKLLGWGPGCGWSFVLCRPHRGLACSGTPRGSGRQRRKKERGACGWEDVGCAKHVSLF